MAGNRKSNNNAGGSSSGNSKSKKKQTKRRGGGGTGPPTAVGSRTVALGPSIVRGSGQTATFSNQEFIVDVSTGPNGTSQIIGININPSNTDLTPWLSRVAAGYELYRFRRLSVSYVPTCSTATAGVVVLACDYDATDLAPSTKQQLSGYAGAVRGNAWSKVTLNITPMDGWYYTGLTTLASGPAGTDQKFYDMGKLYYGVFNAAVGLQTWGELTVSYTIEFAKPEYTIMAGLSERIFVYSSDIATVAGTSYDVSGSNIMSISSPSSALLRLTANLAGEYFMTLIGQYTPTTTTVTNPMGGLLQTDPVPAGTTSQSVSVPWVETIVGGAVANANTYFFLGATLVLKSGSILNVGLGANLSAFRLINIRFSSYRKALG